MGNIIFTGGDGNLSTEFKKLNYDNHIFLNRQELDITDCNSIDNVFNSYDFDYVIHTAALTRPMKKHDDNPIISIDTNIVGTANMVKYCIQYGKKMIYISTDYVYGPDEYSKETDGVNPLNKYGWSKMGGECSVMMMENYLIVRLAMTEYPFPHEYAFDDVYKSSIWVDEVPKVILQIIDEVGVINVGGDRKTIYDFVKERNLEIKPKTSDGTITKDSSMSIDKLNKIL